MLIKDSAVCIRAVDYSETSQVVTLFARATGKISAIAKGSKRAKSAFDGPIEVLSSGCAVFSDSQKEKLAVLTEFQQQPGPASLRNNLHVLNCCLFAAELLGGLTHDYDPHPDLFDAFTQFLQDACRPQTSGSPPQADREVLSLLILFQLTLLKEVGLQPVLDRCANCKTRYEIRNTRYEIYFSSSANGLICKDCEAAFAEKTKLSKSAAGCLINLKMIARAEQKTLNEIEKTLVHHFTEILGRPPKMAKHILRG
jgi:DNA repair protein RecO (recombination protein O)